MMTKWDTIQEDIKDQYAYLDEVDEIDTDDEDIFGFAKAISIEHLTDEQLDMVSSLFDKEMD